MNIYSYRYPLLASIVVLIGAFFFSKILPFFYDLHFETMLLYTLDYFLVIATIFIFLTSNKSYQEVSIEYFSNINRLLTKTWLGWFFIGLIFIVVSFNVIPRIPLILSGVTREELVFEYGRSRAMMFCTAIILFMTASVLTSKSSLFIKGVFLYLFLLTVLYSLSRSDILSLIYLLLIFYSLKKIDLKTIVYLTLILIVVVVFSSAITIYQGRSVDIVSGIYNMSESLFKYSTFSMYLSEKVISDYSGDFEKIFFPFFGFLSERFLSVFANLDNPVGVQNSSYISDFVPLGYSNMLSANVVYPWWPWFVAIFGYSGLFIKFLYSTALLTIIYRLRLIFTTQYMLYVLIFVQFRKHPFLNNDSVYFFVSIIMLDLLFRRWLRKKND
ncbi:oligosaccharide repeat unit polymerase [Vibrio parahaemolyticus]|uniref:Putative membrane protein n=1 Tax=Vibrio parahaemolyticus TaxID=670 RepID=A0A5P4S7H0_VIBPH|nr:oligosaccharide repeat unit polymerase [Vibrio parahaemolyticus]QFC18317.1 putative membrane protein [Vibrio parahaemolyticus]